MPEILACRGRPQAIRGFWGTKKTGFRTIFFRPISFNSSTLRRQLGCQAALAFGMLQRQSGRFYGRNVEEMNRTTLTTVWVPATAVLATVLVLTAWGSLRAADGPDVVAGQSDVARLIEKLGSEEFVVRRRAEQALIRFGFTAFDELKEAENHRDLEIAARAAYLTQLVEVEWVGPRDSPKVAALLRRYGEMSEDERQVTIALLAALRHNEGLDSLCRIVRFEKSQLLSKRAALEVLRPRPSTDDTLAERGQVIRKAIGGSRRPAVKWLRIFAVSLEDPSAAVSGWDEIVAEEQRTVDESPDATHQDMMASLLYTIAQIHSVQASDKLAETLARRAFEVREKEFLPHYLFARMLNAEGLTDWSEREYRHVMKLLPEGAQTAPFASELALMLYDRNRALDAAEVLQEVLKSLGNTAAPARGVRGPSVSAAIGARMEFYYAEHFAKKNDLARQREHLDRAVEHDRADADVLIAMYRLSGDDEAYRKRARNLIKTSAAKLDITIKQIPRSPTAYNHWAWLIANTEGDFSKAVRYSRRSLELQPNTASYLDTLAHCYFATGDYENAVKYQQQAAELEPNTQTITRQFDFFKKALAESQGESK